jgi:DNA-binding NarL/FixJ family response regulator
MRKSKYRKPDHIVRVAIVEDHTVVKQALVLLLKKEPNVVVVFHAENGEEFLAKLPNHEIDIVLLDLDMPVMDGRETLKVLRTDYPQIKAIILSMHEDPWIVSELIREGARSYLKKNCSFDEMINALFDVKFKGSHTTEVVEEALFSEHEFRIKNEENIIRLKLSARNMLILKMICDGKTSEQIANKMNLSKKSIDAIRAELLKRICAKNPIELVRKSILLGLYKARTDTQILEEELLEKLERNERKYSNLKNDQSDDTK